MMNNIQGIPNAAINKEPLPKQERTQAVDGTAFKQSFGEVAARSDVVVRGSQLAASGLHERKLVRDKLKTAAEQETDILNELHEKIARIDDLLKQMFPK